MLSKRKTEDQSSDALTESRDSRSGNSLGQGVDVATMPTGNSTDNLSEEVLKVESASDRTCGDVDDPVVSFPDGGGCADDVNGVRNVRKLLMLQIKSFIMDPDIDNSSRSRSHFDDSSLEQSVQSNELNLELKEVTELPLENIRSADAEAIINKSQSYSRLNTAVDYSKSEHSNNITTEDGYNCTSESEFDISKGNFFGNEGDFDSMLKLLLCIRDICFEEEESLSKQESLDMKQFEGFEERNRLAAERPEEVIDDACGVFTATLPSNDSPVKNNEYVKEHIISLWKQVIEIFERKQFSSAVILRQHLETVEKIKNATDLELQRQQDSKRNSKGFPNNMKFENVECLERLSTKANNSMTDLSDKLIQWQDFNEIRADLRYELAKEQDSLDLIEAGINSEDASLDAGHDLKLVEEMESNYYKRLMKLRRCNRDFEGLLDDRTREAHRSQLGTLETRLQHIKMSCSRLRKRLHLPGLPLTDVCLQSGEEKEVSHSVYSQTDDDDDDDDDDVAVPASVSLVKMLLLLLLMLIVLVFLVVFFFLEPQHWYNQVNSFRLPVLYHLRHVGTFPPV